MKFVGIIYQWETDSEDYVTLQADGMLGVSEDGSSERQIPLSPKAARKLGKKLIKWAKLKESDDE